MNRERSRTAGTLCAILNIREVINIQFNVHKWAFKTVILFILLFITVFRFNSALKYRELHKYDKYINRELRIEELHSFSSELLKSNKSNVKINFVDYSFNLLIDNNEMVKSFTLVAAIDNQDYRIEYDYNSQIAIKKIEMKKEDQYERYSFSEMEIFVDLLYKELNLSKLIDDDKCIRIVRMIKLTKDFVYEEEGNFDKVSYSKKSDDKTLNIISDGEVIEKDGVKINININTDGFERENRVASVYLYY